MIHVATLSVVPSDVTRLYQSAWLLQVIAKALQDAGHQAEALTPNRLPRTDEELQQRMAYGFQLNVLFVEDDDQKEPHAAE